MEKLFEGINMEEVRNNLETLFATAVKNSVLPEGHPDALASFNLATNYAREGRRFYYSCHIDGVCFVGEFEKVLQDVQDAQNIKKEKAEALRAELLRLEGGAA